MADHAAPSVTGAAREPAAIIGLVTAAVTSILALLVAFGVELTQEQQIAILGVIAGVGPLIAAFLIRGQVSAASTVILQASPTGAPVAGAAAVQRTGDAVVERATVRSLLGSTGAAVVYDQDDLPS